MANEITDQYVIWHADRSIQILRRDQPTMWVVCANNWVSAKDHQGVFRPVYYGDDPPEGFRHFPKQTFVPWSECNSLAVTPAEKS